MGRCREVRSLLNPDDFARENYLFHLPEDRIAQEPAARREDARLLVAGKEGPAEHTSFQEINRFFRAGDVLVLNRTRVMKARCFAYKETGVRIEVFVLDIQGSPSKTPVLVRPAKRVKPGTPLHFPKSNVRAKLVGKGEQGKAFLCFPSREALHQVIREDGRLPLPPYIKRATGPDQRDELRYQTVFASELGAVAAPTAGLHFTRALLDNLGKEGVQVFYITHHVGIGTFKPLTVEDIRDHTMEPETYTIDQETAAGLNRTKGEGRRIIAVGTTTTRCLESNYDGCFHSGKATTNHYIYPGYHFKAINGLVTNFHLPGSTLILLVCALMGRTRILELYHEAIQRDYRFYSYGDAMFLLP